MNIAFRTIELASNVDQMSKLKINPIKLFGQHLQTEKVLHLQNLDNYPTIPLVFHRVDIEREWKFRKLEAIDLVMPVVSHPVDIETEQVV